MKELKHKLLDLAKIWYEYVSLDHHKSRDLIFQVVTSFDIHDNRITYQVYRPAYVGTRVDYEEFSTEREAYEYLIDVLVDDFQDAITHLENEIEYVEKGSADVWFSSGGTVKDWRSLIEKMGDAVSKYRIEVGS